MSKHIIIICLYLIILTSIGCQQKDTTETKSLLQKSLDEEPKTLQDKEQIKTSIVKITTQTPRGEYVQGTGFVAGNINNTIYILTASHVVAGDSSPHIEFFSDIREFEARVLESEEQENGIALLAVTGTVPLDAIPLHLSDEVNIGAGESVFTFGFPRTGGNWSYDELSYSSRKGRELLFSNSDIKEGNSGSPLIKENGREVIGIVTSITDFAYAFSSISIKEFLRGARGGEMILGKIDKGNLNTIASPQDVNISSVFNPPPREEKILNGIVNSVVVPKGTIIASASIVPQLDQEKIEYGIYTKYLLQEMQEPQKINDIFQNASTSVKEITGNKQVPWYNSSIISDRQFCIFSCSNTVIHSIKRFALVIGNNNYEEPLQNSISNAHSIATLLTKNGFEVTLKTDATYSEIKSAIQELIKNLSTQNGIGLFYFSGDSIQIDGKDYFIPVGVTSLSTQTEILANSISRKYIVDLMQSVNSKPNIIIYDTRYSKWQPKSDLEVFMSQLEPGEVILIEGSHHNKEEAVKEAISLKNKYPELFYPQKNSELTKGYGLEGVYFDGKLWVVYLGGFYSKNSAQLLLDKVTTELKLPRKPFLKIPKKPFKYPEKLISN